jgi:ferric-dicitrate binding protein FerR (iron transport regulator)
MNQISEELLVRFLQGRCTQEEEAVVDNWENESPEHRHLLEQIAVVVQASDSLRVMKSVSPEAALQRLNSKLKHREQSGKLRRILFAAQRVAAVLLLPVLALSIYLMMQNYNDSLSYVNVKTNSGMVSSFDLPDGTKVWLNSGGKLTYPEKFASKRREVYLNGQGYFTVAKDAKKPFVVSVNNYYSIEVLGTEFNVMAYDDDDLIETTLIGGKVQLNIRLRDGRLIQRNLKPQQKATYNKRTHQLQIATVNVESYQVWREGRMIFRRQPMEQVLKTLGRYYNVRFDVKDPSVLKSHITGKFSNEPLSQVLKYLELASGIKFNNKYPRRIENDTLSIGVIEVSK